jgi:hypothetical protein
MRHYAAKEIQMAKKQNVDMQICEALAQAKLHATNALEAIESQSKIDRLEQAVLYSIIKQLDALKDHCAGF